MSKQNKQVVWMILLVLGVLVVLTAFSSALPDGLEWVAGKLGFLQREREVYQAPLADYTVHSRLPAGINHILSAILGIGVVAGIVFGVNWWIKKRSSKASF